MRNLIFILAAVAALAGCARELGSAEVSKGIGMCRAKHGMPEFEGYKGGRGKIVERVTSVWCRYDDGTVEQVYPWQGMKEPT